MKAKRWLSAMVLVLAVFSLIGAKWTFGGKRVLIILQAGSQTHEGMARALHAFLYAKELKEAEIPVAIIFDGAGTEWAKKVTDPQNKLHRIYQEVRELGVTQEICGYCAGAFRVKEDLMQSREPELVEEYSGHPSIVKWIRQGYRVLVL